MVHDTPAHTESSHPHTFELDAEVIVALACFAFFGLTLFVPPGPLPLAPPAPDAPMIERLFPGVPGWWAAARLGALLLGTLLLGRRLPGPLPTQTRSEAPSTPLAPALWAALAIAATHALASLFAGRLSRWEQGAYAALLFAPAVIAWLASRPLRVTRPSRSALLLSALILAWVGWRLFSVWDNPRVASLVDLWLNDRNLTDPIEQGRNLLTSWDHPGVGNIYILFTGADLFHPMQPPSLAALQACGIVYIGAAAGLVAWSVARVISMRCAPVAAAAVLFAPLTLAMSVGPFPWGFYYLLTSLMLALVVQIHTRTSVTALLLLGAVAGISATQGFILPVVPAAVAIGVWCATRTPPLPAVAFVTAGLSFLAATLPSLPAFKPDVLREDLVAYTWQWVGAEKVLLAQRSYVAEPTLSALEHAGRPGTLDIAMGGILAPFAIARTPLRLCADVLLEPWTAILTAIGLLLCLRHARRDRRYWVWFAAWLFIQLPMILTSKYDRASIARNFVLPVTCAPMAALAFEAVARRFPFVARPALPFVVAAVAALSGALLFEWVNPRLLATSAMEIILETTRDNPAQGGIALLYNPDFEYLHEGRMVARLPGTSLQLVSLHETTALPRAGTAAEPVADILLWSPGLQQALKVSQAVCTYWPDASIYTLYSRSRTSHAFAAAVGRSRSWNPRLTPVDRWQVQSCASFPHDTETAAADHPP